MQLAISTLLIIIAIFILGVFIIKGFEEIVGHFPNDANNSNSNSDDI